MDSGSFYIGQVVLTVLIFLGCMIWLGIVLKRQNNLSWPFTIALFLHLLPILAAPVVFYVSIFIFDNPPNTLIAILAFLALNSYSFILAFTARKAIKSYHQEHPVWYWFLPSIVCWLAIIYFSILIFW